MYVSCVGRGGVGRRELSEVEADFTGENWDKLHEVEFSFFIISQGWVWDVIRIRVSGRFRSTDKVLIPNLKIRKHELTEI